MTSRIFNAVLRWKSSQGNKGGRGNTSPSRFVRLPEDVLHEMDDLIDEYHIRYGEHRDSPRSARLFEFLDRLNEVLEVNDMS